MAESNVDGRTDFQKDVQNDERSATDVPESDTKDRQLREMFDAIDTDKDGRLSLEEMIRWYHSMGLNPTQQAVQDLLAECDANGSRFIEFDEYKDKLKDKMDATVTERDELMAAFQTLDQTGDGTVSYLVLKRVLTGTGDVLEEDFLDDVFNDMDVNKDGAITYKDLVGKICKT